MKKLLDIPYADDALEAHKLDVYLPDGKINGAAVWFYGGGLEGGERINYAFMAENLTEKGYALILPSYRLMPEYKYPDFIIDAALAVKKVKELFPNVKLLVGGSSAGAYLSMMLCFARGYLDKVGLEPECVDAWLFNSAQPTAHYNILKNAGEDSRRIIVDETAPLWHITDSRPDVPMLLLVADDDMYSRRTQNILTYETLLRFGHSENKVKIETLNGFGHCGYDAKTECDSHYYLENRICKLFGEIE